MKLPAHGLSTFSDPWPLISNAFSETSPLYCHSGRHHVIGSREAGGDPHPTLLSIKHHSLNPPKTKSQISKEILTSIVYS